MTSNGVMLPKMAQPLKDAGLSRINISIDSLKPERFKAADSGWAIWMRCWLVSGSGAAGFKRVKLNAVILAGFNDDEVLDLARFAVDNQMDISFIEEMPLGEISSHQRANTKISSEQIRQQLETEFKLLDSAETTGGPSRYARVADSDSKLALSRLCQTTSAAAATVCDLPLKGVCCSVWAMSTALICGRFCAATPGTANA